MTDGPLIDALRRLDPEGSPRPVDSEALLRRVQAAIEREPAAPLPARRRPTRTAIRLVGAAAAIAAAIVGVNVLHGGTTARAGWSATPSVVSFDNVSKCEGPGMDEEGNEIPLKLVLAERRGEVIYALLRDGQWLAECTIDVTKDGEDRIGGEQFGNPMVPLAPDALLSSYRMTDRGWDGKRDPVTRLRGEAAPGVTGVTVTLKDGTQVRASVAAGLWTLWYPGTADPRDEIVVTLGDEERTVSLSDIGGKVVTPFGIVDG